VDLLAQAAAFRKAAQDEEERSIEQFVGGRLDEARRKKLFKLLETVESGQFDSWSPILSKLYSLYTTERDRYQSQLEYLHGPRPHYVGPNTRSTYNYGYMNPWEMSGAMPHSRTLKDDSE
jgi:hypothetical protein